MDIINNPTLESNIEKVANWIVEECDDTKGEVKWLLEKLFAEQVEWVKEIDHIRTLNEDITNVYDGVFEYDEDHHSSVYHGVDNIQNEEQKESEVE